jgi:hypothetical protein
VTDEREKRRNATESPKEDHRKGQRLFFWREFDERLLTPKRDELYEEMSKRIDANDAKIALVRHGNYLSRRLGFLEPLIDEYAGRLYAAYCRAWEEQDRSVSPSFIRAIRDRPIAFIFAGQKLATHERAARWARQRGESLDLAALKNWDLKIDRLATRWWHKLEAEAVACEYRTAAELTNTRNPVHLKPPLFSPKERVPKKPGPPQRLGQNFVILAGRLWREALPPGTARVSKERLLHIASQLDEEGYKSPSKYLEGQYGRSLREFNSKSANAKPGSIKTWSRLVQSDDKHYTQGMRRLLSRCARKPASRFVRS